MKLTNKQEKRKVKRYWKAIKKERRLAKLTKLVNINKKEIENFKFLEKLRQSIKEIY